MCVGAHRRGGGALELDASHLRLDNNGSTFPQGNLLKGQQDNVSTTTAAVADLPVSSTVAVSKHDDDEDIATIEDASSDMEPSKSNNNNNKRHRQRKPQLPGKTAKMHDRHFVVHNYHDHAQDPDDFVMAEVVPSSSGEGRRPYQRKNAAPTFPHQLHDVLEKVEQDGYGHIISWQPHGRCFVIHQPKEFTSQVMPKYFRQTKLTSFQRQLNLYGFSRLTRGADAGGYYHELFLRGKPALCKRMVRTKVKGTKFKAASNPDQEPNFYAMAPVSVTPPTTSDEESSTGDLSSDGNSFAQAVLEKTLVEEQFHQDEDDNVVMLQGSSMEESRSVSVDQVVNDAFLPSDLSAEDEDIADFIRDWDPNFGATVPFLEDDVELGLMLDKLLEEGV